MYLRRIRGLQAVEGLPDRYTWRYTRPVLAELGGVASGCGQGVVEWSVCYSRSVYDCARIGQGGSSTSTSLVLALPCQLVKPCQACVLMCLALIGIVNNDT